MKKVIVLTGSELRHSFMRKVLALSSEFAVVRSYCEGLEQSLTSRLDRTNAPEDGCQNAHVEARTRSEDDFFGPFNRLVDDRSNPVFLPKGAINEDQHIAEISALQPDLLAAFGCSLIDEPLISAFPRRFLNVHLGLSPYYRGSGTNFFPLVDGKPEYVGATFMYLDAGIDTGEIIHQIRARVYPGDSPHQIGNRLIADVAKTYAELIANFDSLQPMPQPEIPVDARLCKRADFTEAATAELYRQFSSGMVDQYLKEAKVRCEAVPIVSNPALEEPDA